MCTRDSGPEAFALLRQKSLQGLAEQPAIQSVIDNLAYTPGENIVAFEARFSKFVNELDPKPADAILSEKLSVCLPAGVPTNL